MGGEGEGGEGWIEGGGGLQVRRSACAVSYMVYSRVFKILVKIDINNMSDKSLGS